MGSQIRAETRFLGPLAGFTKFDHRRTVDIMECFNLKKWNADCRKSKKDRRNAQIFTTKIITAVLQIHWQNKCY